MFQYIYLSYNQLFSCQNLRGGYEKDILWFDNIGTPFYTNIWICTDGNDGGHDEYVRDKASLRDAVRR